MISKFAKEFNIVAVTIGEKDLERFRETHGIQYSTS